MQKKKNKKNWRKASNSPMKIETRKTINSYKFFISNLDKNLHVNTLSFQPTYRDLMKISA